VPAFKQMWAPEAPNPNGTTKPTGGAAIMKRAGDPQQQQTAKKTRLAPLAEPTESHGHGPEVRKSKRLAEKNYIVIKPLKDFHQRLQTQKEATAPRPSTGIFSDTSAGIFSNTSAGPFKNTSSGIESNVKRSVGTETLLQAPVAASPAQTKSDCITHSAFVVTTESPLGVAHENYVQVKAELEALKLKAVRDSTALEEKNAKLIKDLQLEKQRSHEVSRQLADAERNASDFQQRLERSNRDAAAQAQQALALRTSAQNRAQAEQQSLLQDIRNMSFRMNHQMRVLVDQSQQTVWLAETALDSGQCQPENLFLSHNRPEGISRNPVYDMRMKRSQSPPGASTLNTRRA
jgi:hypothetical protein